MKRHASAGGVDPVESKPSSALEAESFPVSSPPPGPSVKNSSEVGTAGSPHAEAKPASSNDLRNRDARVMLVSIASGLRHGIASTFCRPQRTMRGPMEPHQPPLFSDPNGPDGPLPRRLWKRSFRRREAREPGAGLDVLASIPSAWMLETSSGMIAAPWATRYGPTRPRGQLDPSSYRPLE